MLLTAGVLVLGGCAFSAEKKAEINLKEDQAEVSREEKTENDETPAEEEMVVEETEETENVETPVVAPPEKKPESAPLEEKIVEEEPAKTPAFKIIDRLAGWGHTKSSGRKIDTIIVHSSYNALDEDIYDLDKIIAIYKSYGVAPHYIISRDGQISRMVEDKNIAYHAGESKVPDGRTNVNNFSIGIEMVNSKTEGPTSAQYGSLKKLLEHLKDSYDIKYTLGHSDIAPGRKDDPWKFDWGKVR
jgi:hypothetical protein